MRARFVFSVVPVPTVLIALGAAFFLTPEQAQSEVEARPLAQWPTFTGPTLRDGTWTRDVEFFVADHFPAREAFVSFTFAVRAHFGVVGETTIYRGHGGALGGFDAPLRDEPPMSDAGPAIDVAGLEVSDVESPAPPDPALAPRPELPAGPVTVEGGVLISQGRGMMLLSATDQTARAFASVLNLYGATLTTAKVYAVMVPGAGAFFLPPREAHRSADELHNLEVMKGALDAKVTWADVAGELSHHLEEDLYYRTDHHWTGLGAYYGYRAIAQVAAFMPLDREDLHWRKAQQPTLGSLYRITQDATLKRAPDVTEYPAAPVAYESVSYQGDRLETPVRKPFVDDKAQGYLVYLGGDAPLMVAKSTSRNGRRALLVKNSFGNPLAPLLLPHFEEVVVIDYRMYSGTVRELVRRFHITDVFVQNSTLTANDSHHLNRLRLVLSTPTPPPPADAGAPPSKEESP